MAKPRGRKAGKTGPMGAPSLTKQGLSVNRQALRATIFFGLLATVIAIAAAALPVYFESQKAQPVLDIAAAYRHDREAFEIKNIGGAEAISPALLCVHRDGTSPWRPLTLKANRDGAVETPGFKPGGNAQYLYPSLCYPTSSPPDSSISEVYIYIRYRNPTGKAKDQDWDFIRYRDRPGWWSGDVAKPRATYRSQFEKFTSDSMART